MSKKSKVPTLEIKEVKSEMVPFTDFFHECLARGLVNTWQEKEIHAFFKDIGLNDKEPTDKYKIALAKF